MDRRGRGRQLIEGVAALLSLFALVVGVPIVLWKLAGWPFPNELPTWIELRRTLTRNGFPPALLIKTLAVMAWVVWLDIAVSAAAEIAAWVRNRPASAAPTAGFVQPAVRKLVVTAAMLLNSATNSLPIAAAAPAVTEHVVELQSTRTLTASPSLLTLPTDVGGAVAIVVETAPVHVVQRRDTLWGLAEAHLGDPLRWRELFYLNEARVQIDGSVLIDPDLIHPGWLLSFPADAVGLTVVASIDATASDAPTASEAAATDPPASATDAPTLVEAEATASSELPSRRQPPAPTSTNRTALDPPPESNRRAPEQAPRLRVPLPVVGGGLLAGSLLVTLTRLRRVQQRRRQPGQPTKRPRPDLAPVETAIRAEAAIDNARLLDLGLRAFLAGCAHQDLDSAAAVQAVRLLDGRLEVLLDRPLSVRPDAFEDLGGRRAWRTERSLTIEQLERLAAEGPSPLPALVSLGVADGGEFLIDLETAGVLAVDGEHVDAEAFIRRVTTELAHSGWADHVEILVTDARLGDLTGSERIRSFRSVDEALDELETAHRIYESTLLSVNKPTTLAARHTGIGVADWIPTVLLQLGPLSVQQHERLSQLVAEGGRGISAVIPAPPKPGAVWTVTIDSETARLAPLGIEFSPHVLDERTSAAIDELLTDAAVDDPIAELTAQAPKEPGAPTALAPATAAVVTVREHDFDIEVRVLGDVDVVGASFERKRVLELVAYLALHPKGVTDERLKTALWPDKAPSAPSFNTLVSYARTGLGRRDDDTYRFPHFADSSSYRLDKSVSCDAARFETLLKHARRAQPADAIEALRAALKLVRGETFGATSGYEWAHTEGLAVAYETMIVDAGHLLATQLLADNDFEDAEWAAKQALKASPGNEVLFQDRMKARASGNDLNGVKGLFRELCEIVEANEPYDTLHPETIALFEQLTRSGPNRQFSR